MFLLLQHSGSLTVLMKTDYKYFLLVICLVVLVLFYHSLQYKFEVYHSYLCQTTTSISKVQKKMKQNQTILKSTSHSRHFLIRNKTAKITYFKSKRQYALRVRLYLTYFWCYIVYNIYFINQVMLHRALL